MTLPVRVVRQPPEEAPGADGLIRPVDADLEAVTALGREVERQAGEEVMERLRSMRDLPVGAAVVTPGGGYPAELLIHVVIQSADEPPSEATVGRALLNGLRRAREWGLDEVATPPLGTGAGALEAEAAASLLVATVRDFHGSDTDRPGLRVLVATEYEEDVFRRALASAGRAP